MDSGRLDAHAFHRSLEPGGALKRFPRCGSASVRQLPNRRPLVTDLDQQVCETFQQVRKPVRMTFPFERRDWNGRWCAVRCGHREVLFVRLGTGHVGRGARGPPPDVVVGEVSVVLHPEIEFV